MNERKASAKKEGKNSVAARLENFRRKMKFSSTDKAIEYLLDHTFVPAKGAPKYSYTIVEAAK